MGDGRGASRRQSSTVIYFTLDPVARAFELKSTFRAPTDRNAIKRHNNDNNNNHNNNIVPLLTSLYRRCYYYYYYYRYTVGNVRV